VDENENYHPYHKAATRAQNELISTLRPTSRKAWRKSAVTATRCRGKFTHLSTFIIYAYYHIEQRMFLMPVSLYQLETEDCKLRVRIQPILDQNGLKLELSG